MFKWLNPIYLGSAFSHFLWLWCITFPLRKLYPAVPSALALAFVGLMVGLATNNDSAWRRGLVEAKLREATARGAKTEIALLTRRLLQDAPQDPKLQFAAATASWEGESKPQSEQTIRRLALQSQYGPAVFWMLEHVYKPVDWNSWSQEERNEFGALLKAASRLQPENLAVAALNADYLLSVGSVDLALGELTKLAATSPPRGLQGAVILRQLGREDEAASMARKSLASVTALLTDDPKNVDLALLHAQFQLFLKEYRPAVEALNKIAKQSDDQRLRTGTAEILVLWSRDQAAIQNPTERFARQLTLLSHAVKLAPNHPLVISDLMNVVLQCSDDKDPKVSQLRDVLVQGIAPELSHFIRGTSAMLQNDTETATLHLELAAKSLPSAPAVLNNLAVAIATQEEPDLDRALNLVNTAIKQVPEQPYFHETKAQILLRQKDYAGAVVSFEKSLPAEALRSQVHEGLSKAYAALGQTEMAEKHQEQAERFRQAEKAAPK
jgi:tetratricopeptide (TPR) repeat protein